MGSGSAPDLSGMSADRSGERALNIALAKAQKEQAQAEASASMAQAKSREQEQMAKEKAQKEAIQAAEAAAAVEVEKTEVAGQPDVGSIVSDRPSVEAMSYLQIPDDEEETGPTTEVRGT
tara:strand:- start:189 stop:548 length:360 start_codon:yes stop_codon:yes gene_type:complete